MELDRGEAWWDDVIEDMKVMGNITEDMSRFLS